jgi:hypothetical protein
VRPECVEQRIVEQAARLAPDGGVVTAWAALRWRGAAYFDGRGPGGTDTLPVPLILASGHGLRPHPASTYTHTQLAPKECRIVAGLPVASVQRALFDEVVQRGELWAGVQAIDMAVAARLISLHLFALYVLCRAAWEGVPLVRKALSLASANSWSPRETWLRLVWILVAELRAPLCNVPVFDRDGRILGIPDLFDVESGTAGEYDGEHHKDRDQHRSDVSREARFRDHGIEYFAVVRGDTRAEAATRMLQARSRAKFLPPESRAWTLEPPWWWTPPEPLDAYLDRMGLVEDLTLR